MRNATTNRTRSLDALHTALWSSYAAVPAPPAPRKGARRPKPPPRGSPLTVDRVSTVLHAEARRVPRPLLALATANLVGSRLRDPGDALDTLAVQLLGSSVAELRAAHGAYAQPLLMLAELYGLVDYRWTPLPITAPGRVGGRLELCVQRPFQEMKGVVDPASWFRACGVFWNDTTSGNGRRLAAKRQQNVELEGQLKLPGHTSGNGIPVTIAATVTFDGLRGVNRFWITGGPIDHCRGELTVEKEPGRPGATRVTHEKHVRFAAGPLANFGVETLAYWIQAETLCLLLPR